MRLFLFTDEPIVAEAMSFAFGRTEDLKLEKILDGIEQILPALRQEKPDILLLSLTPALHLGMLTALLEAAPECRIVLWARSFSPEMAHQAMELGIRGILPRTCSTELLIKCLRKVYEGELWFDRRLTSSHMTCRRIALTPRQAELVQLVAGGWKNKEIAATLSLSEGAVKVYLSHLFDKLGIKDRMELAQLVMRNLQSLEVDDPLTAATGTKLAALYVNSPEAPARRVRLRVNVRPPGQNAAAPGAENAATFR